MGATAVLKRNKETLFNEFEERLLNQVNNLYIKDKFLVDCGVNKNELKHTLLFYNILESCGEEISQYIARELAFKNGCEQKGSLCETIKDCKDNTCCEIGQESVLGTTDW